MAFDQRGQQPARHLVDHLIAHPGAAVLGHEAVGMHPFSVGTAPLGIDKQVGRSPNRNLGPPTERHTVEGQLVIDHRALG